MPKAGKQYKESDYADKPTSLKNWLMDENLDRAAGIEPTHPGHTVDDNPRWSGVGKGDGFRPHNHDRYNDNIKNIYGDHSALKDVIKTSYRAGGKVVYTVSTDDGIKQMNQEEYSEYISG